jgi:hypothetical protein
VVSAALPQAALSVLAEAEAMTAGWSHATLAPGRARARGILEVCASVLTPDDDPATVMALARGLADIHTAQARSFPDNLFADCDYMAASLIRRARVAPDPAGHLGEACAQIARLQRLYGCGTTICFRYVHDFVYGYDWAKWVAREPDTRAAVLPYDREFLAHMEERAHELLALIRSDDAVYPTLPKGQERNAFPFSREPADEAALHRALVQRGELPVAAWDADARPAWDRPYAALRVAQAERLGLMLRA